WFSVIFFFFFSSRRRHTRLQGDWSSDVCSSDLGIRLLNDDQVDVLRAELEQLMNPEHPGRHLFHEYHSNESTDADRVLFHALGAWRVLPGFHDLLWNPAFLVPASQLLGGPVRFWHDQLFCKPARHGGVVAWHQDYSY